ncbi:hypothetical protein BC937DRAFT_92796 [Endogone sp. FLAS-F59071]|nr:hypothetical protein BC937DRAFT_92796 [Endogone sp. FLAS-F59071]|eukprot:RUS21401.1 hypothetical protein BC937DRAFT_92796 [Endogone sp. FLAS-F59071]
MADPSRTLLNLLHAPQPAAPPQHPQIPYGYPQQAQQQQQHQLSSQFPLLHYPHLPQGPPPSQQQLLPGVGPGPAPQISMQPGFQPPQFAFPLLQQQQQQPQGPVPPQHSPNALASLLHSLNQVPPPPVPSPSQLGLGHPSTRSPIEHPGTSSTPETPQTPIIDRLSTESLKLVLFGPPKPPRQDEAPPIQSPTPTNPVTSSLLSASSPDLSASASTIVAPEASAIPLQQPPPESPLELDYSQLNSLLESPLVAARKGTSASTGSVTPTASTSTPTPAVQKPIFTYMNPFHLLQKAAAPASPAKEQQRAEVDTQKTEQQQGQGQPQSQGGNNRKALRGQEGTLDHTVPKHRGAREGNEDGQYVSHPRNAVLFGKGGRDDAISNSLLTWHYYNSVPSLHSISSFLRNIPDGFRLPPISLTYNCALSNQAAISHRSLRVVEIARVPSAYEFHLGKTIAVNQEYICYAVKDGKIRVIYQPKANKTLLRGHGKPVLDMAFAPADHALLASIDRESRLFVWRILGVAEEDGDQVEIPYKLVLELKGTPTSLSIDASSSSRFRRVTWHPTDPDVLAVATDREIWIVNLGSVLAGREDAVVDETEAIEKGVVKLEGYEEPVNDLVFSPDGTVLATAGADGLIHLWLISYTAPPTLLTTFATDPATFVAFADGSLGPSTYLSASVRYLITGHDRNRVLKLWSLRDPASGPLHSLAFVPPPSPKNSLGAAGPSASPSPPSSRNEIPMFNLAAFDRPAGCVVVANSARASLFAVHLQVGVQESSVGSTAEVIGSAPGTTPEDSGQFDYIVEVPVKQPITSVCLVSEETSEDSRGPAVLVYAVQTAAVRYYQLDTDVIRPTDWEKAEVIEDQDMQENTVVTVEEEKREQVTIMASEVVSAAEVSNVGGVGTADATKEVAVEAAKESAMEEDAKKARDPEPEPGKEIKLSGPVVNGAIAKLKEKRRAEQGRKGAVEVAEEPAEDRDSWASVTEIVSAEDAQAKALREMLGGPKKEKGNSGERREKHRERKEGKEKEKEKESEKERDKDKEDALAAQKFDQTASSSNTSTPHRLSLADVPRLSPQPLPNDGAKVITPTPPSPKLAPVSDPISSSPLTLPIAGGEAAGGNGQTLGMQQVVKELRKVEDNVANKVGKVVGKEMNKQYQRLEEDRIAHQAAETSRQETILKLVSQTLNNNTQKLLDQTIRNEMQTAVIPSLGKTVTAAVEKQLGKGVVETMNKVGISGLGLFGMGIANAIDKSVADNVNRIMSKPAFIETVSKAVAKSLRPLVEETFKESFGNLVIPAYQNATTQMFEQISGAFDKGLQTSVTKSVGEGVADVHTALARMQTSVDALAQQIRDLQAQVAASQPQPPVGSAANTFSTPQPTVPAATQMQMQMPSALGSPFDWRAGSTAHGGTVVSGRYGSPDPYGTRSVQQGPSSAGSAGSTLAYRSGPLSQLVQPTVSAQILQLNQEIDQAIARGDYDDAFWKALQSNDQAVVLRLCSKLNPALVLGPLRPTLNQPVLLSLLHNLSVDLTTYMELRFNWIQEVLLKLNPKVRIFSNFNAESTGPAIAYSPACPFSIATGPRDLRVLRPRPAAAPAASSRTVLPVGHLGGAEPQPTTDCADTGAVRAETNYLSEKRS